MQAMTDDIAQAERDSWLSKLESALEEARELLLFLDDGEDTDNLIERIGKLKEDVGRHRAGSGETLGQDHPIWTELARWVGKTDNG